MYFVVYRDQANQWRWTLYAANHRKLADSGESYWNKNDCLNGVNLVAGMNGIPVKFKE